MSKAKHQLSTVEPVIMQIIHYAQKTVSTSWLTHTGRNGDAGTPDVTP